MRSLVDGFASVCVRSPFTHRTESERSSEQACSEVRAVVHGVSV